MFLQLFGAAAATGVQVATSVSTTQDVKTTGSFLTELGLDCAMYDAILEAALALAVFGAVSAMLSEYRKRNPKNKAKAKLANMNEDVVKPVRKPDQLCARKQNPRSDEKMLARWEQESTTALRKTINDSWKRQHAVQTPPGLAAKTEPRKQSEMDNLVQAVKAGKAADLPHLLDAALERSLAASTGASSEDMACQLLLSALRACAASRSFADAVNAYTHMSGRIGEGNANLWSVLFYSVVEAGAFDHCELVLDKLCGQTTLSAHDFVNMVRCYVSQQNAVALRERLNSLRLAGYSVDAYTWNRALAVFGASESALDLSEELLSANISSEGIDAVGYNTLIKYNARAGRISRCFELQEDMATNGVQASEITFGILLDACVAVKDLDNARKIFSDLCSSGLRLNVVHCTTFMKVLLGANLRDEAAKVLDEMIKSPGVKPDLITFSTLVKAYADSGDVSSAMKVLESMLKEGVKPDEIVFNCVLNGCCAYPLKSSEVLRTFEKLIASGMRPTTTTLSILLKGLSHTSAWQQSLQVLRDAPKKYGLQPEVRLFAQVAQSCVKARDTTIVIDVFDTMVAAGWGRKKPLDKDATGRFLRSCLLGGTPDTALELQKRFKLEGIPLDLQMERMFATAIARKF